MTTDELVRAAAEKGGFYIGDMRIALNAIMDTILEAVADGDVVKLQRFGVFKTQTYAEKRGRDMYTGETVLIPARKVPVFKPCRRFRETIPQDN